MSHRTPTTPAQTKLAKKPQLPAKLTLPPTTRPTLCVYGYNHTPGAKTATASWENYGGSLSATIARSGGVPLTTPPTATRTGSTGLTLKAVPSSSGNTGLTLKAAPSSSGNTGLTPKAAPSSSGNTGLTPNAAPSSHKNTVSGQKATTQPK